MNQTTQLRMTETNSADDSQGKTWGLEGNLFWVIIGGGFVSVTVLLVLFSVSRWSLRDSLLPAAVPIVFALYYALALRQGKPDGYDTDLLDEWIHGKGFGPNTNNEP